MHAQLLMKNVLRKKKGSNFLRQNVLTFSKRNSAAKVLQGNRVPVKAHNLAKLDGELFVG
jgi:hypothetical protein